MNLNRAQVIGNLTRDPEGKTTPGGQTVCTFGVATSQKWKDAAGAAQERVEFHNVTAWGKLAEICVQFLKKGRKVFVEGRLQTDSWEKDGVKRSRTSIVAENMIMLDGKGTAPEGAQGASKETGEQARPPEGEEIKVEDIPF